MKFIIRHEMKGRIRIHFAQDRMSFTEADTLQYFLNGTKGVTKAKVYERTADAAISYTRAVSYTHLDVYKRQPSSILKERAPAAAEEAHRKRQKKRRWTDRSSAERR